MLIFYLRRGPRIDRNPVLLCILGIALLVLAAGAHSVIGSRVTCANSRMSPGGVCDRTDPPKTYDDLRHDAQKPALMVGGFLGLCALLLFAVAARQLRQDLHAKRWEAHQALLRQPASGADPPPDA